MQTLHIIYNCRHCILYYHTPCTLDAKEELCFGKDLAELTSLKGLSVNVTRSGPGCEAIVFHLSVTYNKSEMESEGKQSLIYLVQLKLSCFLADSDRICAFDPWQLQTICTIDLNDENQDFETSRVQGLVKLTSRRNISICNESKTVFVYNG